MARLIFILKMGRKSGSKVMSIKLMRKSLKYSKIDLVSSSKSDF